MKKISLLCLSASLMLMCNLYAETTLEEVAPQDVKQNTKVEAAPVEQPAATLAQPHWQAQESADDYTLGADDVIEIIVRRHPEFSDKFTINKEGKIQYKFVGDIDVSTLTKAQLQKKITEILSQYILEPDINITVLEYRSKVFYVIGEVGRPGKYYMMGNTINVREAVVAAGLPTLAAAMRKCRLIHPTENGKPKSDNIDIYTILYGGNLKNNINLLPGDVLYIPSTMMAKVMRVISPVSAPISTAVSTGKTVVSAGTMP